MADKKWCLEVGRNLRLCAGAKWYEAEIERLTAEVTKLKEGLKEALEWDWCDDDYPENLYYELSQLCKDDDELRDLLADRVSGDTTS